MRGDVTFYAGGTQLEYIRYRQSDTVEVGCSGHDVYQGQMRSIRMRARTKVHRSTSSLWEGGGVINLMLELGSCFPDLVAHAPRSSCRSGRSVRVVRYGRPLRDIKEFMAKSVVIPTTSPSPPCGLEERRRSRPGETCRNERFREKGGGHPTRTTRIRVVASRIRQGCRVNSCAEAKGRKDS